MVALSLLSTIAYAAFVLARKKVHTTSHQTCSTSYGLLTRQHPFNRTTYKTVMHSHVTSYTTLDTTVNEAGATSTATIEELESETTTYTLPTSTETDYTYVTSSTIETDVEYTATSYQPSVTTMPYGTTTETDYDYVYTEYPSSTTTSSSTSSTTDTTDPTTNPEKRAAPALQVDAVQVEVNPDSSMPKAITRHHTKYYPAVAICSRNVTIVTTTYITVSSTTSIQGSGTTVTVSEPTTLEDTLTATPAPTTTLLTSTIVTTESTVTQLTDATDVITSGVYTAGPTATSTVTITQTCYQEAAMNKIKRAWNGDVGDPRVHTTYTMQQWLLQRWGYYDAAA